MSVQISYKQHGLKKQQAHRPYRGGTTKPWQNHLANQGLDLE
jgi:hypothetical protein